MKSAAVLSAAALLAAPAFAQVMKPESQQKQRKAAYTIINNNFGSLWRMTNGKKPYDRDEAVRNADLVAALADYPKQFFGEGTDKGETRAKPGIWQKRADFDDKMDRFVAEAKKLPQAARGDAATLKKAVADVEQACDACHDDYRAK